MFAAGLHARKNGQAAAGELGWTQRWLLFCEATRRRMKVAPRFVVEWGFEDDVVGAVRVRSLPLELVERRLCVRLMMMV